MLWMSAQMRPGSNLTFCKSRLKDIGTAMEKYSADAAGEYPATLEELIPKYLPAIPECPQNGADAYRLSV